MMNFASTQIIAPSGKQRITEPPTIRVSDHTPMTKLNEIYPKGIPVYAKQPTLSINGMDCYEIVAERKYLADLAEVVAQDATPIDICFAFISNGVVAVPSEWVEVEIQQSAPGGL